MAHKLHKFCLREIEKGIRIQNTDTRTAFVKGSFEAPYPGYSQFTIRVSAKGESSLSWIVGDTISALDNIDYIWLSTEYDYENNYADITVRRGP